MNDTNLVIPVFKCKRKNILRRFSITFSKIYKNFYKRKHVSTTAIIITERLKTHSFAHD